jgi:antagonist of KipI
MSILVKKSGPMTTLQDMGRIGFQKYGVLVNGAMDSFSSRLANILVGNDAKEASLEMTMIGATLELPAGTVFALTGGDLAATINGQSVPQFRPVYVKETCILRCGFSKRGCRGYFAVAGGFAVPSVMGSKSTYLRAKMGGFKGRPLHDGDILETGTPTPLAQNFTKNMAAKANGSQAFVTVPWLAPCSFIFGEDDIRVVKGQQFDWFTADSIKTFFSEAYTITLQSDRMGYRLDGKALERQEKKELVSEPVTFGSIQVPADGKPIILLADRQTAGGYPKIASVVHADLPRLAQHQPNTHLHFKEVSLAEAEQLYFQQEDYLTQLAEIITKRLQ